jgi:hypothetical protein
VVGPTIYNRQNCGGFDNKSIAKPYEVLDVLLNQNIVVDVVMVCTVKDYEKIVGLWLLATLTSGAAFCASSLAAGLEYFELEAFLNHRIRITNDAETEALLAAVHSNEDFVRLDAKGFTRRIDNRCV